MLTAPDVRDLIDTFPARTRDAISAAAAAAQAIDDDGYCLACAAAKRSRSAR